MALQSTGAISLANIQTEFTGSNPIGLNEYYRGGTYVVSSAGNNINIPTSGTIAVSNFYGTQAVNFGTLTPSVSTVAEGSSVTFTIVGGTGIPNGTYPWRIEGANLTAADVSGGSLTGSLTITSNAGSFAVSIVNDYFVESGETIRAHIGAPGDTFVATPAMTSSYVNITDGSTISVSISNSTLYRAGALATYRRSTITVTSNYYFSAMTTVYFSILPISGTVDTSDLSQLGFGFSMSGSYPAAAGSFNIDSLAVYTGKSTATFQVQIRTGSTSGPIIATSGTITILPSMSVSSVTRSPTSTTVNESTSIGYTVNTNYIPNSTNIYYQVVGVSGTINASDFTTSTSAAFTINSNTGQFNITLNPDLSTEGTESFRVDILAQDAATVINTGTTITISDSSLNPPLPTLNSLSFSPSAVNIGETITVYWESSNATYIEARARLSGGSWSAWQAVTGYNGSIASGNKVFGPYIWDQIGSYESEVRVGNATNVSTAQLRTYTIRTPSVSISRNTNAVNEGGSVTYTITPTNVPTGTTYGTLYWYVGGSGISGSDFTDGLTQGGFTNYGSSTNITRTLNNDVSSGEGNETLNFAVYGNPSATYLLGTSNGVTIYDTSVYVPPPSYNSFNLYETWNGANYVIRLVTYINNPSGTVYLSATAYYAVGINQPASSCTNAYPALNISSSGAGSSFSGDSAGWTVHSTGFTVRYYVTLSGAVSYSNYTGTTNIYI